MQLTFLMHPIIFLLMYLLIPHMIPFYLCVHGVYAVRIMRHGIRCKKQGLKVDCFQS